MKNFIDFYINIDNLFHKIIANDVIKSKNKYIHIHNSCESRVEDFEYKIILSGYIHIDNFEQIIYDIFIQNNLGRCCDLRGDFILAIISENKLIIYNSLESQYDLFWNYNNRIFSASTLHFLLEYTIDNTKLSLLCYGENTNPFENIQILPRGHILIMEKSQNVVIVDTSKFLSLSNDYKNLHIDEISDIAYKLLKNSIHNKLVNSKKCALMLSGGIDSSAIARCIYDLGIDVKFITWTSINSAVDEGRYSRQLASQFEYELKEICVDEDIDLIPQNKPTYFSYIHSVSAWWERACEYCQLNNIDTLISGHYAGIFDSNDFRESKKNKNVNFYDYYHAFSNCKFLLTNKTHLHNKNNLFRKIDIFTDMSQNEILSYINEKNINYMRAQEYSYKINLFDIYGLTHVSPYLDTDLIDLCSKIPNRYKNNYLYGTQINKIILRYSMLDKLPHNIVSRVYTANLNYMSQKNLLDFTKKNTNYFNENSILVQKKILNLEAIRKILSSDDKIISNTMLSNAILIESWLKNKI